MSIDRLLTKLSSDRPPVGYRKMTIYMSTQLGLSFRKAAINEGFRLVDFARALVTLD